jgi:hypothetical protein
MLKPVPKKKKIRSLSAITRDLDTVVSKIVRLRDKRCVTCGSTDDPQAGHFESRKHFAIRWDLSNVHQQCSECNCYLNGNMVLYYKFIQLQYGWKYPDTLHALARGKAPNRSERMVLLDDLKAKLRELEALQ